VTGVQTCALPIYLTSEQGKFLLFYFNIELKLPAGTSSNSKKTNN
jgi:hypothetical protein